VVSKIILILFFCACQVTEQNVNDALKAREQALQALNGFNPASVLKGYTQNPKETTHLPQEGNNHLRSTGLNALPNNPEANDVYQRAGTRTKGRYNPNSSEMKYAEKLLENPEEVLDGVCYTQPSHCETKKETKTCKETMRDKNIACGEQLTVTLKPLTQHLSRWAIFHKGSTTLNLTQCDPQDRWCSKTNLVELSASCEGLSVVVTRKNKVLPLTKHPTCKDPTFSVSIRKMVQRHLKLEITVTQWVSEESWSSKACDKSGATSCILANENSCLEPNASKIIQGIPITRPCWGRATNYRCTYLENSECMPIIMAGCSQTGSQCLYAPNGFCELFLQTFSCMSEVCVPEKTICPDRIPCSSGECDLSYEEASDDAAEGLSRLGVLAGAASDVATNQVRSGVPAVFAGTNSKCRKVFANMRNCCGGSYEMTHCSGDEKHLAKAKEEGRAFKVGTYCAEKIITCLEEKESWCVFPTKLAAILQIQGRHNQLGINFGWAGGEENKPNCRGITPEELEHINFSALDLSPIEQELMNRRVLPHEGQVSNNNQAHIERLKQEGKAHD
jgi:conjugal transfer mating pair stabilization protein TraN